MGTFDEILSQLHADGSGVITDKEVDKPIEITSDRKFNVPEGYNTTIAYVGDVNSQIITFKLPKTHEGHDLSKCANKKIKWRNISGDVEGYSTLIGTKTDDSYQYLQWTIPPQAFAYAGALRISITLYDIHNNKLGFSWNTPDYEGFTVGKSQTEINLPQEGCAYAPAKDEILLINERRQIVAPVGFNNIVAYFGDRNTSYLYFQVKRTFFGIDLFDEENTTVSVLYNFNGNTYEDFGGVSRQSTYVSEDPNQELILFCWKIPAQLTNNEEEYSGKFTISISFQNGEQRRVITAPYGALELGQTLLKDVGDDDGEERNDLQIFVTEEVERVSKDFAEEVASEKIDEAIVQKFGESDDKVVSQKVVSQEIRKINDKIDIINGAVFDFQADSTVAYEKAIPAAAEKYIQVDKVGGATTRVLDHIENKANFRTAVGNFGGVKVTYDTDNDCFVLDGTYNGEEMTYDLWGDYFSATEPTPVVVKYVGGTVSGENNRLYLWDDNYMPIVTVYMRGSFYVNASTGLNGEYGGYGIGTVSFCLTNGSVFTDYRIRILVDGKEMYNLTENKPTALRVMSKNLLPFPYESKTGSLNKGVTFNVNEDGSITTSGVASGVARFTICNGMPISAGTYTLSGSKGGSSKTYRIVFAIKIGDETKWNSVGDGATTFTITTDALLLVQIAFDQTTAAHNRVFKPQLERGSVATAYTKPSQTISTTELPSDIEGYVGLSNGEQTKVEGWGQGVPSVGGNYITFTDDGRVLYQKTSYRYTCTGEETWNFGSTTNNKKRFYCRLPSIPLNMKDGEQPKAVCNHYDVVYNSFYIDDRNCVSMTESIQRNGLAYFYDANFAAATVAEWKDYVKARAASGNPIIIEYALAELPDPIDITDRFDWDGFIEGQGNGSVIVENNNKTMADLPTTLVYQIRKSEW